jgi:hypothetical protein
MSMAKHTPAVVPVPAPAVRVIHYTDPANQDLALYQSPAQIAARQRDYRVQYAKWALRQEALAERDRKVRRFWLGFGAVTGVAVLAVLVGLVCLIASIGLGLLAVPLLFAAVAGVVVGGNRCITIVQHWH